MKVIITGSSKLAKALAGALALEHRVKTTRIEDITMNGANFWGFDYDNPNHADILINNAHKDFDQTNILDIAYRAWKKDSKKYIINISSRAHQPNISKGYLYAAQKASLNHLTNNLTYNSDKQCRISTINLGLLNHELPSLSYDEVAHIVKYLIDLPTHIEVPEITVQNSANYQDVQDDKIAIKEFEWLVQTKF